MKVSVIIPTYKSEQTLLNCLDSVKNQSFTEFECLIVDYPVDNSTYKVAESFIKKDDRFRYVESSIKGAISQRELGIKNSTGSYICFIDSDDIVDKDYISILVLANNKYKADITICRMVDIYSEQQYNNYILAPKNSFTFDYISGKRYLNLIKNIRKTIGNPTTCCTFIKRSVALEACQFYNSEANISLWEDSIFNYYLLFNSNSATFINNEYYYYYIHTNETKKQKNDNRELMSQCIRLSTILLDMAKTSEHPNYYKQCFIFALFGIIVYLSENRYSKKDFFQISKSVSRYKKCIRVFEKEFGLSERLIALSIKFNIFVLCKIVTNRIERKNKMK